MAHLKPTSRKMDTAFIIGLFTVFAATTLLLVLIAAKQYKQTASSMTDNFEVRTATSYLREAVSQHDSADAISLTDFDGITALTFTQVINETDYTTYIYYYDGSIRELFVSPDALVSPESGSSIIEATGFTPELCEDNLLKLTYTDSKEEAHTLYVHVHSLLAGEAQ